MPDLERETGELLREKGLTLGIVESATGGLISHLVTNVPDCSDYYLGSVTSYANAIKTGVIGVKQSTLAAHGAVSAAPAEEMAAGEDGCSARISVSRIRASPGRAAGRRKSLSASSTWGWRTGNA
jgi:PncC family amidohydrolase